MTPLANFTTATDLNDATRNNCVYRFNTGTANNPGYNYGFCYAWTEGSNVHQLAVPRGGTSSIGMSERSRGSTGEWGEWVAIPTRAELTALNNSLGAIKSVYSKYDATDISGTTKTITIDMGIYLVAIGKLNTQAQTSGIYLVVCHALASSLIPLVEVASSVATVSINKTTLSISYANSHIETAVVKLG